MKSFLYISLLVVTICYPAIYISEQDIDMSKARYSTEPSRIVYAPVSLAIKTDDNREWFEDDIISKALNHVQQAQDGLVLTHPQYKATFTKNGLVFDPTSQAPTWQWSTVTTEYGTEPQHLGNKIVYERGSFKEEYVIRQNTIEQQFVLEKPILPRQKVLRIEGAISCNGAFESASNGWRWKNEKGEVTFTDVYVYDASGKSIPALMQVTSTSSLIEVRTDDLDGAEYPVTIDPEIGTNDFRISVMGDDNDTSFSGQNAAVAYNQANNTYLVVWEGSIGLKVIVIGQLINGTTGAKIGSQVQFSNMGGSNVNFWALRPDVTSSTSEFLVVWHGDDNSGTLIDNELEIYAQRVNASTGAVIGGNIRVSDMGASDGSTTYIATRAAVAFSQTQNEFLIVWRGDDDTSPLVDGEFEIFGQRLSGTGAQVGDNDFRISDMGPDGTPGIAFGADNPDVAWNSTSNQYMVVWDGDDNVSPLVNDEREIFGQRLDATNGIALGMAAGNDFRISDMGTNGTIPFAAVEPSIAYNSVNNNYLVVWKGDDDVDGEFEIFGQILTNIGEESGADFQISDMGDNTSTYIAELPAVSYDPFLNQFLVCWNADDNTTPLTNDEFEIYAQVLTGLGVETGVTDFRLSDAGGLGNSTYNTSAPATVFNGNNREHLIVWHGDDNSVGTIDNKFEIWGQRFAELSAEPTNQPTSPVFSSVTASAMTVSFTAAASSPTGYLALRRTGASPTDVPVDGTAYAVGSMIGSSTVAHIGSSLTFNETSLAAGTTYHYDIFSFNGANASLKYRTATPLEGSRSTLATEPPNQPTLPVFSSVTTTSMTASFTAAAGAPAGYLALRRISASPVDVPVDGTTYTVGNTIGSSTVAFIGSALTFNQTSLTALTSYHYDIFSFNGSGTTINYLTAAPLEASRSTLATEPVDQPTNLVFSNVDSESLTVSFTAASGPPNGYIVIRKKDAAPTSVPVDGIVYSVGDNLGDATVVFTGTTTTFNDGVPGLEGEDTFFYQVFAANFQGSNLSTINYRTISPLSGSQLMLAYEPGLQARDLRFTNITTSGFTVSFTDPGDFPEGYIAIRKTGSSPTSPPVDVTVYSVGQTVGDGTVAYVGSEATFNETLSSGNYFYDIYTYNGGVGTINYLTSAPLEGNVGPDNTAPIVTDETAGTVAATQDVKIIALVRENESSIQSVVVEYKSVSNPGARITQPMTLIGGRWEFTIPSSSIGELGIEYTITATNTQGLAESESDNVLLTLSSQTVPFNSFGTSVTNYRIISIPLNLNVKSVNNVLADDLEPDGELPYDKSEWRIFRYESGTTVELGQSSPIELGKGYWLIVKSNKAIGTGPGQTANATSSAPFTLALTSGWNQIGNPYPFDVSWSDVLSASGNPTSITKFKTYEGSWNESASEIKSYQGGFVFSNGATTLTFPATKNTSVNRVSSREAKTSQLKNSIDEPDWEINLTVRSEGQLKEGSGIGMRQQASEEFDPYDDFSLPRFLDHLELNHAKKLFESHYSKDIVPTGENHIWHFTVDVALAGAAEITWENDYFKNSTNTIFLLDVEKEMIVDMKERSSYTFNAAGNSSTPFKIIFGSNAFVKENSLPKKLSLNSVFPNPSAGGMTIGFTTPNYEGSEEIKATINSTMSGHPIALLSNQFMQAGYHELVWDGRDNSGLRPSPGVYLLEVRVGNQVRAQKIILR